MKRTRTQTPARATAKVERYIHPAFKGGECELDVQPKGQDIDNRIESALVVYGD